jgi:cGMP-dependent protein kinase
MTIKAIDGEARVLALGKDTIQNILGEEMQTIVQKNNFKWALQKT